jgi:hypothetical protein
VLGKHVREAFVEGKSVCHVHLQDLELCGLRGCKVRAVRFLGTQLQPQATSEAVGHRRRRNIVKPRLRYFLARVDATVTGCIAGGLRAVGACAF